MSRQLEGLKGMGIAIGDELDTQDQMLGELHRDITETDRRTRANARKAKKLAY
jgi:hypothetical protein